MKLVLIIKDLVFDKKIKHTFEIPDGMKEHLKSKKQFNGEVLFRYCTSEGILSLELEEQP